ncbi:hypothetical protein [Microvirga makkahensis]|uniref:Uncharacterized protein n=1 Tax=Microvirga makkahensis TaxID=1128670 RepID=A0A7X3MQU2_9HYPH|nr:hypothetical protein [Microvirga makkahensis]MXQ11543.1 hypothetical protein [Microvirga makkahensis]
MPARDQALAVSLAALTALIVTALAVFAAVPASLPQNRRAAPGPACSEWTDGCIVCARTPQGLACSSPGIACVRQAPRCLRP